MSDENNYTIWRFLKTCHERGWIYKGHDVMPWCPRCGTGISEHEIVTEGYQERTHTCRLRRVPAARRGRAPALLVWTTTPWTLAANVAAAVHPELTYIERRAGRPASTTSPRTPRRPRCAASTKSLASCPGANWSAAPIAGRSTSCRPQPGVAHRVIAWDEVSAAEGTGIVHIAPGCGKEDFALSKANDLP